MKRGLVAVCGFLLLLTAACTNGGGDSGDNSNGNGGSGEKVTLQYWVTEEGHDEFTDAVVAAFEKKYPNITIQTTSYPEDNYGTKIETSIAAGSPPDLGNVANLTWIRKGLVLPLDDMVQQQGIDLSSYNSSIIGDSTHVNGEFGCSYQGKLYCLGSYLGAVGVFYNKDMFDAAGVAYPAPYPPMTIQQFVDTACQLTDKANGVWGAAYGYPVTVLPWETEFSTDGKTATGVTNDTTDVDAYAVMAKGIDDGCAPSLSTMDPWEQGADYFAQGKLAMVVTDLQAFKKIESAGINYGVTSPPTATGVEPFLQTWTDGVGVFTGSEHPTEAEQFVAFLTTEGQKIRVQVTGDMPLSSAIADQTNWAGDIPGREEALQVVEHARPAVFIPNRWDTVGPLFDAFDRIVGGDQTAQQALDEAVQPLQENLDNVWQDWNSQS